MNTDMNAKADQEDKPLTRTDIEILLKRAGSSDKLILKHQNLSKIDLHEFVLYKTDLSGANLTFANLRRANLREANLSGAYLSRAYLSGANLSRANLSGANLSGAYLSGANLSEAYLSEAYLSGAYLSGANLTFAYFSEANLSGAYLSGAYLNEAYLSGANLSDANLSDTKLRDAYLNGADLSGADLSGADLSGADLNGVIGLNIAQMENAPTFRIRIMEEPLTPHTLTSIISAVTTLSTQCWLIANERFADLIEYTQTNDVHFVEEAQLTITRIRHNSSLDASFKIDLSASNIAKAITTSIDGIIQANKMLEIERERLEILEKQLDLQGKVIEYALKIAIKTVSVLEPNADEQKKAVLVQSLLPTLLQLQNGKGLVLVLPAPQSIEDKKPKDTSL